MTVWKFQLEIADNVTIAMPLGSEPLHVAMQDGALCLWAHVYPNEPYALRTFYVTGTGNPTPDLADYVGTVHAPPFVWHVWEEQRNPEAERKVPA